MNRAHVVALLAAALALIAALGATASAQDPETDHSREPCFGAASMDPQVPCRNPALRTVVEPLPYDANLQADVKCDEKEYAQSLIVCGFARPDEASVEAVAIVGDSHAAHYRSALRHVAEQRAWRVYSMTHASCPLQKALRKLREPTKSSCTRFKRSVYRWFERHPEIRTVFVSGLTGGSGVIARKRMTAHETSVLGYKDAWEALPESVERIIVLRDIPKLRGNVNDCVADAVDQGLAAGEQCRVPIRTAFDPDPMLEAATLVEVPQVQVVDLSQYFCDAAYCYPVIGGALVMRDSNHMTGTYSASLGPYMAREVDRVLARFKR